MEEVQLELNFSYGALYCGKTFMTKFHMCSPSDRLQILASTSRFTGEAEQPPERGLQLSPSFHFFLIPILERSQAWDREEGVFQSQDSFQPHLTSNSQGPNSCLLWTSGIWRR